MSWDKYAPKSSGEISATGLTEEIRAAYTEQEVGSISVNFNSTPKMVEISKITIENSPENNAALQAIVDNHDGALYDKKKYVASTCAARSSKLSGMGLVANYDVMTSQTPPKTPKIILNGVSQNMILQHRNDIQAYTAEIQNFFYGLSDSDYNAHTLQQWKDNLASNQAPWPVAPQTVLDLGIF